MLIVGSWKVLLPHVGQNQQFGWLVPVFPPLLWGESFSHQSVLSYHTHKPLKLGNLRFKQIFDLLPTITTTTHTNTRTLSNSVCVCVCEQRARHISCLNSQLCRRGRRSVKSWRMTATASQVGGVLCPTCHLHWSGFTHMSHIEKLFHYLLLSKECWTVCVWDITTGNKSDYKC